MSWLRSRWLWGLAAVAIALGAWQIQKSRTFQLFGAIVPRVETSEQHVALTFDDGPLPAELALLPLLAAHRARATFFVCGEQVARDPAAARRLIEAGHELGNHSYSHRRMIFKAPGWIAHELDETDRLIRAAGQRGAIHFRPPYGKKLLVLPLFLASTGRTTIMWDLEPETEAERPATGQAIADHVLAHARPGSIILLHARQWPSRAAVRPILAGLSARGYRFVTVSQLLAGRR